jgi:hypothetical protein
MDQLRELRLLCGFEGSGPSVRYLQQGVFVFGAAGDSIKPL